MLIIIIIIIIITSLYKCYHHYYYNYYCIWQGYEIKIEQTNFHLCCCELLTRKRTRCPRGLTKLRDKSCRVAAWTFRALPENDSRRRGVDLARRPDTVNPRKTID